MSALYRVRGARVLAIAPLAGFRFAEVIIEASSSLPIQGGDALVQDARRWNIMRAECACGDWVLNVSALHGLVDPTNLPDMNIAVDVIARGTE